VAFEPHNGVPYLTPSYP